MPSIARQVDMCHGGARKCLTRWCELPVDSKHGSAEAWWKEDTGQFSGVKTDNAAIIEGERMDFVDDSHTLLWHDLMWKQWRLLCNRVMTAG